MQHARPVLMILTLLLPFPVVLEAALPAGFERSQVTGNLNEPTVIEFTPDGRLLIGERGGRILVVQDGAPLPAPLIQITTNTGGERGLVGLALDPDFAANGYLYAYYATNEPRNRVGRFTVVGNTADPATEVVVWQNSGLAGSIHHGGTIRFGPDGNLYIATGDNSNSANAQMLSNQFGKILRVARDGSIPADNPFIGVPGAQSRIWAYGLRNPFRFVFDSVTGHLWIGDVGGAVAEEINRGTAGANYGWPNQEGPFCNVSDCSPYTFPVFAYQQQDPEYYHGRPQASITLGPVYRATAFPAEYRGSLFYGDYANQWIRRLTFDDAGNVAADLRFDTPPDPGRVVDLKVGPDGALYYVDIVAGGVFKIRYTGPGNAPPIAVATADVTQGPAPLTVRFTGSGSSDPDSGPEAVTHSWDFGDGGTSILADPEHVYQQPGVYTARLTVSDGADSASSVIQIRVGTPPSATIARPAAGSLYRAGDVITFEGSAVDQEDGNLGPTAFSWRVLLRHSDHTHPFFGPVTGVGGTFTIPSTGHSPENTNYEIHLTVTDSTGLTDTRTVAIFPVISSIQIDTVPSGIPVFLDGVAQQTRRTYNSLVGFQHTIEAQASYVLGSTTYIFQSWSDGGARVHTYVAPEGGGSVMATYTVGTVTSFPAETIVLRGSLRNGAAASLNADDNSYFEVSSGKRVTEWYAGFSNVPKGLANLKISYQGKNSQNCTQTVAIYRWTTGSWVQLDSRSVGTTEVLISDLVPGGTLADYVSGTSGNGNLRVRVRCKGRTGNFFSSGELLKIVYDRP